LNGIEATFEVLDKFRNSIIIFGGQDNGLTFWELIFNQLVDFSNLDSKSWPVLSNALTREDLIGLRCFGMFDDIDNGVVVYEPLSFFKEKGDWSQRQSFKD
jgi:hypothetical protein